MDLFDEEPIRLIKVVSVNDGRRTSYIRKVARSVSYPVEEWVKPLKKCGPLTAFRTLEYARKFLHWYYGSYYQLAIIPRTQSAPEGYVSMGADTTEIWECEGIISTETAIWYPIARNHGRLYKRPLKSLPPGTALCGAIKLVKMLDLKVLHLCLKMGEK